MRTSAQRLSPRPQDILHTVLSIDGTRVPDISDATFESAMQAARKVMRENDRAREARERAGTAD